MGFLCQNPNCIQLIWDIPIQSQAPIFITQWTETEPMFDNKLDPGNQIKKKKKVKQNSFFRLPWKPKALLLCTWNERSWETKIWKSERMQERETQLWTWVSFLMVWVTVEKAIAGRKINGKWDEWGEREGSYLIHPEFGKWVIANEGRSFTESFELYLL